jgi:hypothetical protein
MKRYHSEQHIINKRARDFKNIAGWLNEFSNNYMPAVGRFRKSRRCGGCGRARCQVCHPEKYPTRQPTRQEKQNWRDDE